MSLARELLELINEDKNTKKYLVEITPENEETIKKILSGGNVNYGEIKNATYEVYMTGVKKGNKGILNVDINSLVDSPTMREKLKKEIFKKLGL